MTSEVAVINSIGVALAADSAVTVRGNSEKIYTSAEKLLRLSLDEPIGIMIYGSALFENIPWETIIKVYRVELGKNKFDTVEEYANNFLAWLVNNNDIFPKVARDGQIKRLIISYFYHLRENVIRPKLDSLAQINQGIKDDDLPDFLHEIFKDDLSKLRSADFFDGITESDKKEIRNEIGSMVGDIREELFGQLPFKSSTKKLLTSIGVEVLLRQHFGPLMSGIVIAGFGSKQYQPAMVSYEVEAIVNNKIRLKKGPNVDASQSVAVIVPFAQKDMVYSFMEGIDNHLNEYMILTAKELFSQLKDEIINLISKKNSTTGQSLRKSIDVDDMIEKLVLSWGEEREKHWKPVLEVVASLPKSELAEMAESLVNITKLKRKVTAVPETVGGPIDVAIITKGDGFIWMRRKHYFDASINKK